MMTEYEKKELYQYDKQISLEDKRKEGIKEGIKERNYSIAKSMKKDGADINLISKYTGLSIKEIRKLRPDGKKR